MKCTDLSLHPCLPVYKIGDKYAVRLTELAIVAWPVADYDRFQSGKSNITWLAVSKVLTNVSEGCCTVAKAPGAPDWLATTQDMAFHRTTTSTKARTRPIQKDYFVPMMAGLTAFVSVAGPLTSFVHRPISGEREETESDKQLRAEANDRLNGVLSAATILHALGEVAVKR